MAPRLRVRRDVIERSTGSLRVLYERLEICTTPRSPGAGDEASVTGYLAGEEAFVGSLDAMLTALELAREDLE